MNILFGIGIGVLSGIFASMGMGGGTLLIPLLIICLSFSQVTAQCINLIVFIPVALIALYFHFKNGFVNVKIALQIIAFSLLGCILGAMLLEFTSVEVLRRFFALFLIIVGSFQLWNFINKNVNLKK